MLVHVFRDSPVCWLAGRLFTIPVVLLKSLHLAAPLRWLAGPLFTSPGSWWLLATCVTVGGLFLCWREIDWNWNRQFPWYAIVPLLCVGTPYLPRLVPSVPPKITLWLALVVLMLFLELRESAPAGAVATKWLAAVAVLAMAIFFAWIGIERRPVLGYLFATTLMVVGWFEPAFRRSRWERIVNTVDYLLDREGPARSKNWIAHSLGTYLSGEAFRQPGVDLNRVLLVAGAISERYDWAQYMKEPNVYIRDVRNEHGTRDFVIHTLSVSGSWASRSGMENAGLDWFEADLVAAA